MCFVKSNQDLNVGMSGKNIGTYLKSSLSKAGGAENLKSFNSLNIKPSAHAAYKISQSPTQTTQTTGGGESNSRSRQTTLVHRHSNPVGSLANLIGASSPSPNLTNANHLKQRLQSAAATTVSTAITGESAATNALPRIKINT